MHIKQALCVTAWVVGSALAVAALQAKQEGHLAAIAQQEAAETTAMAMYALDCSHQLCGKASSSSAGSA